MAASAHAAQDKLAVDRYTLVTLQPTPEQQDILSAVIHVAFDETVSTVGQALDAVLLDSGYKLAALKDSDPMLGTLLGEPLPAVHRHLGPMHLSTALRTLAGRAWRLTIDRVHRQVSFELAAPYAPCDQSARPGVQCP